MTNPEITALAERLEESACRFTLGSTAWSLGTHECRGAAAALRALLSEREGLRGALEFYANPETYHACGFLFDPPTGGFDEDFEVDHGHEDYPRAMPGKTARQTLSALAPKDPEQ